MSKSKKFSEFVAYCKQLASNHVAIQHTEQEKHFYMLDEVLTGLPSGLNYPAFLLEGYGFKFTDQKSDNPIKRRAGAFVLIDYVGDPGDYSNIHDAWDRMEEIGEDILAKIKADKYNRDSPVYNFNLETVEGEPVATEMGNHYGIRFTFDIDCIVSMDVDTSKWLPLPEPAP